MLCAGKVLNPFFHANAVFIICEIAKGAAKAVTARLIKRQCTIFLRTGCNHCAIAALSSCVIFQYAQQCPCNTLSPLFRRYKNTPDFGSCFIKPLPAAAPDCGLILYLEHPAVNRR